MAWLFLICGIIGLVAFYAIVLSSFEIGGDQ
jgi:hypothetical protein